MDAVCRRRKPETDRGRSLSEDSDSEQPSRFLSFARRGQGGLLKMDRTLVPGDAVSDEPVSDEPSGFAIAMSHRKGRKEFTSCLQLHI